MSESLGLPLLEAKECNLSIIASELDYVRDVCEPNFTFNPLSPFSIAHAVKRYLKIEMPLDKPISSKSFIKFIFK